MVGRFLVLPLENIEPARPLRQPPRPESLHQLLGNSHPPWEAVARGLGKQSLGNL